jgi:hypothetical protein
MKGSEKRETTLSVVDNFFKNNMKEALRAAASAAIVSVVEWGKPAEERAAIFETETLRNNWKKETVFL